MTCSALFFAGEVLCLRNPILDIGASRKLPENRLHLFRRCPGQLSIRFDPGSVEPILGSYADSTDGGQIVGPSLARPTRVRRLSCALSRL